MTTSSEHPPTASYDQAVESSPMGPRILLAEDDADLRHLVALVLRREGYQVVQACDGVGLLSRIETAATDPDDAPYALILCDIMLPQLTAFDVLDAVRCRGIATPVIVMTAYGSKDTRDEASALGARAILDKPVDWAELRCAVQEALAAGPADARP